MKKVIIISRIRIMGELGNEARISRHFSAIHCSECKLGKLTSCRGVR